MLGAGPLLVALAEAALEESLGHLRVELRAGPVGARRGNLCLALGLLDGEQQTSAWVAWVFEVGRLAQPALERVLGDVDVPSCGAASGADFADETGRLRDELVGDGERGRTQPRRGTLSITCRCRPWVVLEGLALGRL